MEYEGVTQDEEVAAPRFNLLSLSFWIGLFFALQEWPLLFAHELEIRKADFTTFYVGGKVVGTKTLENIHDFYSVQIAQHFSRGVFPYLPTYAWLYYPFRFLNYPAAYYCEVTLMLILLIVFAMVLARIIRQNFVNTLMLSLAWPPIFISILIGQNSVLASLLWLASSYALEQQRPIVAGLFAGLLLYKPTYAIFLLLFIALERQWKAFISVAMAAVFWYISGIASTGGNILWPFLWMRLISIGHHEDFADNVTKFISVPMLLERLGVSGAASTTLGILVFVGIVYAARRFKQQDRICLAAAFFPALGPHILLYDAVLVLPSLLRVTTMLPYGNFWVLAIYFIAFFWNRYSQAQYNPLIVVVLFVPIFYWAVLAKKNTREEVGELHECSSPIENNDR